MMEVPSGKQDSISNGSKHSHLFSFAGSNKAGMQNVDKEHQASVIYEMSKNSAFFKRASEQDEKISKRVSEMIKDIDSINDLEMERLQATVKRRFSQASSQRDLLRICCVIDMDMFFAACEIRDAPHLRDLPVAVGGMSMISTSNYVARSFGVRSAMPGFIAKKLCPELVFIKSNYEKYEEAGKRVRAIISDYDPAFRSHSLDEAYLDLTELASLASAIEAHDSSRLPEVKTLSAMKGAYLAIYPDQIASIPPPPASRHSAGVTGQVASVAPLSSLSSLSSRRRLAANILQEIRNRIKFETGGLTCSAGIANNFLLAKICADVNKPDGQFELEPTEDNILEFLADLPTRKVGGIGKVTEKMLSRLGMATMGDVRKNMFKILRTFTPSSQNFLLHSCLGLSMEEGGVAGNSSDGNYANSSHSSSQQALLAAFLGVGGGSAAVASADGKPPFSNSTGNFCSTSSGVLVPAAPPRTLPADCSVDATSWRTSPLEVATKRNYSANQVHGHIKRKSLSLDRTFSAAGISLLPELRSKLADLCAKIAAQLNEEFLVCQTVTLKLKTVQFVLFTRSTTSTRLISKAEEIFSMASQLLDSMMPITIRLMGVALSKFQPIRGNNVNKSGDKIATEVVDSHQSVLEEGGEPAIVDTRCVASQQAQQDTVMTILDDLGSKNLGDQSQPSAHDETDIFDSTVTAPIEAETPIVDSAVNCSNGLQGDSSFLKFSSQSDRLFDMQSKANNKRSFEASRTRFQLLTEKQSYQCPVCETLIVGSTVALNNHIDICLDPSTHNSKRSTLTNYYTRIASRGES